MIKIGHVSDIDKFTVPDCIKFDVITVLMTLDECYGAKRADLSLYAQIRSS